MGNVCCGNDNEDIGARKFNNSQPIAANANSVSDDQLDRLKLDPLSQIVMIQIACNNLPNTDNQSKSDPFAVLWELDDRTGQKIQIGTTECILDTLNPQFVTTMSVEFKFETQQKFQVDIYDADDMTKLEDLHRHDHLGSKKFTLHEIVTMPHQTANFNVDLGRKSKGGTKKTSTVKISAIEKKEGHGQTECQFNIEMENKSATDPHFIIIYRQQGSDTVPVYKSENQIAKNGFRYHRIFSDTDSLANSHDNQDIIFKVYKHSMQGNHKCVFTSKAPLSKLMAATLDQSSIVLKDKGLTLKISHVIVQKRVSFLDYIFGGCEIELQVAVDFTASNGEVANPSSLHYMSYGYPNQYQHALQTVGNILEEYSTNKMFPTFGFGGMVPGSQKASHLFALNGDIFNPEESGVDGILKAYTHSIGKCKLSGPTYFQHLLNFVNGYCQQKKLEQNQQNQSYTFLLILTDGVIMDMQYTIDQIVAASNLPLSIVIVGVGNADFSNMSKLDADYEPLYSNAMNFYQTRDIVQFVPYKKFANQYSNNPNTGGLAKEVLREIPGQIVKYFQTNGISPNMKIDRPPVDPDAPKKPNTFYDTQKMMFIEHAKQQGMNPEMVQAFLDHISIAEMNPELLAQCMNQNGYSNKLKRA